MSDVRIYVTEQERILNEWQERLGLQDWAITLQYNCTPEELKLSDVDGEADWVTSTKSATIRILGKKYYGDRNEPYDFESTLVHELLHLKFSMLDLDGNSYETTLLENLIHQMIDDIARALVMAKRWELKRPLSLRIVDMKERREKDEEV